MGKDVRTKTEDYIVKEAYLNEHTNCIDKMRWSYSRLSCFEHCQYEFYLNYIINDDDIYLAEGNFFAEVGSFVHEILAKIFERTLPPSEALDYFIDNYADNVFYTARDTVMQNTYQACIDYFANEDFSWLDKYEVLGVEKEVSCTIGDCSFVGFIDLLLRDKHDGKIIVVDHKSASYPLKQNGEVKKNSERSFNSYKKQMYLYSYAVKQLYGEYPKELWWNHFKEGGKVAKVQFSISEYNSTLQWVTDTIDRIKTEEDFEPSLEFFYCNTLCNFRHSCEYVLSAEWRK